MEPAIRARLDGKETYMPPIGLGEPIRSPTVGRVMRTNSPDFEEGEVLYGSATGTTTPSCAATPCCSTA